MFWFYSDNCFFLFVFCWFLPWLGFESVCVCGLVLLVLFFACFCLNVMQGCFFNRVCVILFAVWVCVCVSVLFSPLAAIRVFVFLMKRNIVSFILNFILCVCVLFLFYSCYNEFFFFFLYLLVLISNSLLFFKFS